MNRITKKFLKITAFIIGGIFVLLVAFHFWFINHAEQLIEDLVDSGSNGKLKLEVRKFKFNWFSNRMELRNAVFYTADTASAPIAYRFSVKNIRMDVKDIFAVIFEKRLLFDSLLLTDPDIIVTRLRPGRDTVVSSDTALSMPQEMGRIYNSIQDALQVLKVTRFQINNGKFSLINKIKKNEWPVSVSNIYFHLDNLEVDTSTATTRNKIFFSENVVLSSHDQNIVFPSRRHRLSFSNFHINVLNRTAEFDSCTIQASKGDSANTSFSIFFDKLKLINVEFDTLYHNEVIKADSVFCINPRFQLATDIKKGNLGRPPTLNELIQQLIGDMYLGFVSVQNGSFNVNTIREGKPSSFTSDNNNFELKGLRVQKTAPQPLVVDKFVMALHNYENFLRDSAYSIQFDSILIINDRISLSNFAYRERENNRTMNNLVMSQFELRGLSWDNLVFDRNLKAKNVTLYHPVINYNFTLNRKKKANIFQVLGEIGNILQLNNLDIVDGQVNLLFKNNVKLQLENADISVRASQLVDSRKFNDIRKSVTNLNFKKGYLQMNDMSVELSNGHISGTNNQLTAGTIHLKNKNDLDVTAENVAIESMQFDDDFRQVNINGINWSKADISMNSFAGDNQTSSATIILNQIKGNNTSLNINNKKKKITGFLQTISADKITSINGKLNLARFTANGNGFRVIDSLSVLVIENFRLANHQLSSFKNFSYKKSSSADSMNITIPSLTLLPDINALVNGKFYFDELNVIQPVAYIQAHKVSNTEKPGVFPDAVIDKLTVKDPQLYFRYTTEEGSAVIEWDKKSSNNYFEIDNLRVINQSAGSISADQIHFSLNNFLYNSSRGRSFDAEQGHLAAKISSFTMQKTDVGDWDWQGKLDHLDAENFVIDSLGKRQGILSINSAELNDLSISSSLLLNLRELIYQNGTFNLKKVTGSYHDNRNQFNWYNTDFDKKTRYLSADSFSFRPTADKDAFAATHPYRADYIRLKTGNIAIGPIDIDRYISDTLLNLGVIKIHNIYFHDFRDQTRPIQPGITRLLPVSSLKTIPVPFSADTLKVINSDVEYEEVNEKTMMAGTIFVKRLNADFTNVRNYNYNSSVNDSLDMRSTAYINDSLFTKLYIKQSYADIAGGFKIQMEIGPADLRILNPVLKPLALAHLQSGHLDTMTMWVTGNDDLAYGKMKMVYDNFKVTLYKVKNGKLIPPGLLNFFGNFLINNKNKDKTSLIFFKRWKDRSAVNYLLKITLNGVFNSIGLKKNKKEIRQNKKRFKENF